MLISTTNLNSISHISQTVYTSFIKRNVIYYIYNVTYMFTDVFIGVIIQRKIYSIFSEYQKHLFQDCGWPPNANNIPVRVSKPLIGKL